MSLALTSLSLHINCCSSRRLSWGQLEGLTLPKHGSLWSTPTTTPFVNEDSNGSHCSHWDGVVSDVPFA